MQLYPSSSLDSSELCFVLADANGSGRTRVALYRQNDASFPSENELPSLIGSILVVAGIKWVSAHVYITLCSIH